MALFKCKMCGGALEINNNESVATCEYCGTKQTLPKLDREIKSNLYDRANHFRRNNEYDKAMGIYEQILNEDNTDAEAYWSLVLCRYGIEYVEDPSSHKRIPTVNRAQFTAIFDDDNYKSALQYADSYQRIIYEEEAKIINEIQKGILTISQKEDPFDVFICYKETDNSGRRTPDSVLAQELYYQLTQEGFKVFFSRITLEDKLGTAYEPYIFAALNSAKVMVVLGTKPEHFNAVWVKNEWSRYLALIKQGQKKMLIPAYKDMDPYDLPEEFSHLQAQDMSKLGFMQDLIHGIKKIAQKEEAKTTVVTENVAGGNTNIVPLLKRAFMFLEDGDWTSANEYCEKVLDLDPEYSQAYVGKLMVDLRARKQGELKNCAEPFDNNGNYQKAVRFADENLKAELVGYIEHINTRNENMRLEECYDRAKNAMSVAQDENTYKEAAALFDSISEYQDSSALAQECYEKAEICKKEEIYNNAVSLFNSSKAEANFLLAAEDFKSILDYKDAENLYNQCFERIKDLKKDEIYDRATRNGINHQNISVYERGIEELKKISGWRDADEMIVAYQKRIEEIKQLKEEQRIAREKARKRNKIIALTTLGVVALVIIVVLLVVNVFIPNSKYNDALASMEEGNVVEAYEAFLELGDYKDSLEKANSIYEKYKDEKLKVAKVGDYVFFGAYEQDNNTSNGKEDVEWLVLEVKDGKALVISKYALDRKPYDTSWGNVTWETCSLRKWLNNDFINSAFSTDEKAMIPTVMVNADKNPYYSTNPGNATQDQVFLLSITEANTYFDSDEARACKPTAYAKAKGAYGYGENGGCRWWLRAPGDYQDSAVFIFGDGDIYESGYRVSNDFSAVRPAMWIDIN